MSASKPLSQATESDRTILEALGRELAATSQQDMIEPLDMLEAINRWLDFEQVVHPNGIDTAVEAITEAVRLTPKAGQAFAQASAQLSDRFPTLTPNELASNAAFMGMVIGLTAREIAGER